MTVPNAVQGFTIVTVGLLAGQMLAIALANVAVRHLPEMSWTLRFQAENQLFTRTMPATLLLPLMGSGFSSFLTHGAPRSWNIAATVLTIVVLGITMVVNVPINRTVAGWTAGSAPVDWAATRDRWVRFHIVRTILGILALVCFSVSAALA